MTAPTHADGMLLMEYFKLWDTPQEGEAWTLVRRAAAEGAFDSYERFQELVPSTGPEWVLFDRVLCAFEQAATLMRHGLLHPDLYFEVWPDPARLWARVATVVQAIREDRNPDAYTGLEWIAARSAEWHAARESQA